MKSVKSIVNILIKTIIISSIIFCTIKISLIQYVLAIIAFWSLIFFNYSMKKNVELFDIFLIISLGNFISYMCVNIKNFFSDGIVQIECMLISSIIFLIFLIVMLIHTSLLDSLQESNSDNKKLMFKRQKDLERLLYYLDMFNIVGINGIWGGGKSFLVDELKKKVKEKYEIIEIDVLSCNLNELQLILLKEIEKVMYKNRMISRYSNKLKDFLINQKSISQLANLIFPENYSYSETIKGFQNELSQINKKILIIYEDIDRISDEKIIKSIFGISEKLSNDNIKVLYQYHENKLKELGFESNYLEKYIPYKINLTEINFFEILDFVLKEKDLDKNILNISDFDFLRDYKQKYRYNILQKKFNISIECYLNVNKICSSIRKVENYINELYVVLSDQQYKKYEETAISFFLVKHFIPQVYDKLNIDKGLIETLKFNIDSKPYTIVELIAMYNLKKVDKNQIQNIFNCEESQINYCILRLFDYSNDQTVMENDYKKRLKAIIEEPVEKLKHRVSNEKKDRLIWNLLQNGKSKYTDYEYIGSKFIKEVLMKPKDKQVSAYNEFYKNVFHQDSNKIDNKTIFIMGVPNFIELFKMFRILNVTDEQKMGLIDFYFRICNIKNINNELIQILNYCELTSRKEYINILRKINKLSIIGNLNCEKSFSDFLKKYVRALSDLGYIDTMEYFTVNGSEIVDKYEELIIQEFRKMITNIENLKNKIISSFKIKDLEDELNIIIEFFNKMIEMISCKIKINSEQKDLVETSWTSKFPNQDEFERLKILSNKSSDFNKEIKKSYLDGKITAYEISKLIDQINSYSK